MYTFEQLALDIIRNLTDEQQKKEVMISKDGVLSGATELRLGANDQPEIIESCIDFEISDFPPPETVLGLWQKVPSPKVPINRQLGACGCFCICTLKPLG